MERYQSVREMQNDLETVMSDERASEDRYQSSITSTKTVPINKSEIANQTREEDKGRALVRQCKYLLSINNNFNPVKNISMQFLEKRSKKRNFYIL